MLFSSLRVLINREIYLAIVEIVTKCDNNSKLYIASPFLSDIPNLFSVSLLNSIGVKASLGCRVQVLTQPPRHDSVFSLLDRWSDGEVEIRINRKLHGKIIMFQRYDPVKGFFEHSCLVGSANLTRPGLLADRSSNLEICFLSRDKTLYETVEKIYLKWWLQRESVNYVRWKFQRERRG